MKAAYLRVAMLCLGLGVMLCGLTGCATEPGTTQGREELHTSVGDTLKRLYLVDPGFENFLKQSYGYVVFPSAGKGGLIVGGAYGHAEVYEQGRHIGYADVSQATLGLQAGGQSFSEVLAFETGEALQRFERGQLTLTANASAVAMKSGAAAAAKYENGVAVFVEPKAGLMVEAAVGGQSFSYQPK